MNANIEKSNNTTTLKAPLTKKHQEKLKTAILGWGKLTAAVKATNLTENTIKRAAYGFDVLPDTAATIVAYLKSL